MLYTGQGAIYEEFISFHEMTDADVMPKIIDSK